MKQHKNVSRVPVTVLKWAIVGVILLMQVYPIVWVILASVTDPAELVTKPAHLPPTEIVFSNFANAFAQSDLVRYLGNSAVIAALTIGLTVALGAPAAYAISLLRFKHGNKIMNYFLLGIMVPIFVSLLPLFQVFSEVGLRDTYFSVVLPQVAFHLPLCIYLYVGFMRHVPRSLLESASIDGAGPLRVFLSIVLPLSRNTTMTIIIYNFVFVWNEFVFANTFLTRTDMKTLPVGLNDYVGLYGMVDYGATYAAIVFAVLPTLIIYFTLNKRIIEGMAAGAIRG